MLDVLIVDDSDLIRKMIVRTMRMAQLPVASPREASNGSEALNILRKHKVDLVLTDINMPVMNGLELLRHMREDEALREIPVIIVTSESMTDRIDPPEHMGVTAYVRKPFTPELLLEVVRDATAERSREQELRLVQDVFERVLESFTFSYGEPVPVSELPRPQGELLVVLLEFTGACDGRMVLATPTEAASDMAAHILSVDPSRVDVTIAADALGEVVNMTCGHVVTHLQAGGDIRLSPPEVYRLESHEWDTMMRHSHTAGFIVEDRPVLMAIDTQ